MKTKLSPSWIAVIISLVIIAIPCFSQNLVVGGLFFSFCAVLIFFFKKNTPDPEEKPSAFRKDSALNEM